MSSESRPIIVTGATGNTGSAVVDRLQRELPGRRITALVREGSDASVLRVKGVSVVTCDLASPATYVDAVEPNADFVEMANLRHADAMLPHLVDAGIGRAYCVTTTAVSSTFHSYRALYREIEERLRAQPVPTTLLRPSMIYGNARDHNMHKLIRVLARVPVYPVFGAGTALMQPVHVHDLADGIAAAVGLEATGEFDLAGPEPLTYVEILNEVSAALGRKVRLVHVNHGLVATTVQVLQRVPGFPITHEQVMRLLEDKAFDISRARQVLGYAPRDFATGIRGEVDEMRRMGMIGAAA